MAVDLLHPPPYGEVPFKHLGLAYVAAGLRRWGFETRYHDLSERLHRADRDFYHELILRLSRGAGDMSDLPNLGLLSEVLWPEAGDSELAATIRGQVDEAFDALTDADLVGMSFNTLTSTFVAALGRKLRASGVKVFLGGPLSRIDAIAELLLRLGAADVVLAGEGDLAAGPLAEALLAGRPPDEVPGALWLDGDQVRRVPPGPPPALELLPWPELKGNILDEFIPLAASRGCPRKCAYCSETGLWPREGRHRQRRPALVVAEMEARAERTGLTDFHFHDDLLNGRRSWLAEFTREVRGRGFTWESFFEPYRLDRALLEGMGEAGCRLVKYGVQSFSPALLKTMRRPGAIDEVVETVAQTYHLGISTHYDMLIGHPGETEADHQRNLELIEELYQRTGEKLYFSLNPFYLAAGSEVARNPERFGLRIRYADPSGLAPGLAEAVAAGPPYPVGYRASEPDRETLRRRMDELAEVLRRHDKDYLFLGQQSLPPPGPQGRRMLPALGGREGRISSRPPFPKTFREDTTGCSDDPRMDHQAVNEPHETPRSRRPVVITLNQESNLRLWPGTGHLVPAAGPEPALDELKPLVASAGEPLLVTGGEPTLSRSLAPLLALCRHLGRPLKLETNGILLSRERYSAGLQRRGLGQAVVILLAAEAEAADRLGGIEGSLELALAGARAAIDAGVAVDLGVVLSSESWGQADRLAELAARRLPEVRRLRLLVAPLEGISPPPLPSDGQIRAATEALRARALRSGQDVVLEDRVLSDHPSPRD